MDGCISGLLAKSTHAAKRELTSPYLRHCLKTRDCSGEFGTDPTNEYDVSRNWRCRSGEFEACSSIGLQGNIVPSKTEWVIFRRQHEHDNRNTDGMIKKAFLVNFIPY